MEHDRDYLYHCNGCGKADKNYPDKKIACEECEGTGYGEAHNGEGCRVFYGTDENECNYCNGYGEYTPRTEIEHHEWARNDAYGIFTGLYCNKCYNDSEQYTYRKDRYFDESYAGERLEPEE